MYADRNNNAVVASYKLCGQEKIVGGCAGITTIGADTQTIPLLPYFICSLQLPIVTQHHQIRSFRYMICMYCVLLSRIYRSPMAISPLILAMIRMSASRSNLMCTFRLPLTSLLSNPKPAFASLSPVPPLPPGLLPPPSVDTAPPTGSLPRVEAGPFRPPGALPVVELLG